MITVVTPFQRTENLDLLIKLLEGKVNWTVLIDNPELKDIFPSWVKVNLYEKPPENICKPNWLFNEFISNGLDRETQYMILCDDDSVEEGFFDKIPNEDVVCVSMKRGYDTLIADPRNMKIAGVGGEQVIIKGKVLRDFRYGLSVVGDGEMIEKLIQEYPVTYVPDAYVLFNYFAGHPYSNFDRNTISIAEAISKIEAMQSIGGGVLEHIPNGILQSINNIEYITLDRDYKPEELVLKYKELGLTPVDVYNFLPLINEEIMYDFVTTYFFTTDGRMIYVGFQKHGKGKELHINFINGTFLKGTTITGIKKKPVVLFVGDYWCAGQPRMGLSEWEGNIWASLESTGLVDVARFHFDKFYHHYGNRGDSALVESVDSMKPDYIVLIIYKYPGQDPAVMAETTLKVINLLKVPIITIWGDLEHGHQRDIAKIVAPYCLKVIGTANKEIVESLGYTYMHVPKDPRIFNDPNKSRDIDIVFSGSYGLGREERQEALLYLINNGVNLVHGGSEGRDHFTTEEYADRYKRSKLALSFSKAHGVNVVNARPFEVMSCGAMLLEQESPELAKLFTPGVDYVEWKSNDDLLEKVRYYLSHDEERETIARNGQKKIEENYSAKKFWEEVLNK